MFKYEFFTVLCRSLVLELVHCQGRCVVRRCVYAVRCALATGTAVTCVAYLTNFDTMIFLVHIIRFVKITQ